MAYSKGRKSAKAMQHTRTHYLIEFWHREERIFMVFEKFIHMG